MKKKLINLFTVLIVILCSFSLYLNHINIVKADSGFDTSYDSGSSWSSSSSSHSSSGGSGIPLTPEQTKLFVIVFFVFFFGIGISIILIYKFFYKVDKSIIKNKLSDEKIHELDPSLDIQLFNKNVYDDFVEIQKAWMNFDYKVLRTKLTDELYNMYVSQLETLKIKGQRNVMEEFNLVNSGIVSIDFSNNIETIVVYLKVTFKDYIEDQTGKVVRGNKNTTYNMTYRLIFIRTIEHKDNKCPKCGNELGNNASIKCDHCGSVIVTNSHDFVLSRKFLDNQSTK